MVDWIKALCWNVRLLQDRVDPDSSGRECLFKGNAGALQGGLQAAKSGMQWLRENETRPRWLLTLIKKLKRWRSSFQPAGCGAEENNIRCVQPWWGWRIVLQGSFRLEDGAENLPISHVWQPSLGYWSLLRLSDHLFWGSRAGRHDSSNGKTVLSYACLNHKSPQSPME